MTNCFQHQTEKIPSSKLDLALMTITVASLNESFLFASTRWVTNLDRMILMRYTLWIAADRPCGLGKFSTNISQARKKFESMLRKFQLTARFFRKNSQLSRKHFSHKKRNLLMSSLCPKSERKTLKSRWSHKAAAIGIEMAIALKMLMKFFRMKFESRFNFFLQRVDAHKTCDKHFRQSDWFNWTAEYRTARHEVVFFHLRFQGVFINSVVVAKCLRIFNFNLIS